MGFRIQNNIAALNAHRNLGIYDSRMGRSMERLSSGFRINRAADDAAGLSVSQAFRADIASCKVAQRNVSEANSMLQVAEGALDQVGNMLTRMKELATQASSANSASNLAKINAEYGKLMTEVDRIVTSTEYAGTKLLDGTLGAAVAGLSTAGPITFGFPGVPAGLLHNGTVRWGEGGLLFGAGESVKACSAAPQEGVYQLQKNGADIELWLGVAHLDTTTPNGTNDLVFATEGITITNASGMDANALDTALFGLFKTGLTGLNVSGAAAGTYIMTQSGNDYTMDDGAGHTQTITNAANGPTTFDFNDIGITVTVDGNYTAAQSELDFMQFTVTAGAPGTPGVAFQVGNKGDANNRINLSLTSAKTTDIGTGSGGGAASLGATDLISAGNAQDALTAIDKAISDVSALRGGIGADQNRLSYASANLSTKVENITAADSVIRDTDMAAEMTELTKNQILVQAGTAMLAQANQAPQQVLSLLRG